MEVYRRGHSEANFVPKFIKLDLTYYDPKIGANGDIKQVRSFTLKGMKTMVEITNWIAGGDSPKNPVVSIFAKDLDKNLKESDPLPERWFTQMQNAGFKMKKHEIPPEYKVTKGNKKPNR